MNDDLISRKAAIEAIADIALGKCVADEETDDEATCKEKSAMFKAHQDSLLAIRHLPSVPAVPLDKLCEWLEKHACFDYGEYLDEASADTWRAFLTKWMEGLDEAD